MSLKWHPDKAKDEKAKEASNLRFVEINKAYKTLTDEKSRKNWEDYGNPDGPTTYSLGIALPSWLVESKNAFWILALYALGFGLLVPFLVSQSWNTSNKFTKDNILQITMAMFYKDLKAIMNMKELMALIAKAYEFEAENFKWTTTDADSQKIVEFLKTVSVFNDKFEVPTDKRLNEKGVKVFCFLFSQLHRIDLPESSWKHDQTLVVTKAVHLCSGLLKIALVRDWPVSSLNSLTLSQFLIQGVWENHLPLLQLPYFNHETAAAYMAIAKKPTIRDFLSLSEEVRSKALASLNLSPEQNDNLLKVARAYPDCNVLNIDFKILGQEVITPEGVITCLIKLKLNCLEDAMKLDLKKEVEKAKNEKNSEEVELFAFDEDGNMIEASSNSKASPEDNNGLALQPVHAPFYALERKPYWWIFLLTPDLKSFVAPPVLVKDLYTTKTVTLQFQTPSRPGPFPMRIMVRSDCLYGADLLLEAKFIVHKESKINKVVESDWDISDSESENESPFGAE